MDDISKKILVETGFFFENNEIKEILILRESLLDNSKYEILKNKYFTELKKNLSSSLLTSLHNNANNEQKWPLLNLIRQILNVYGYVMKPIRKSDGYTLDGIKKFKRYFLITKK